ncbi:MAG: amidinotransferase [Prevotellaceae bacterium]|jgi:hypothetical protein|nr:amidinotransferase [Prevotellaceae bacterium]
MIIHTANHVLMIRPARFAFNPQTAENNSFQKESDQTQEAIHKLALTQFDAFVSQLRNKHINVTVVQDTLDPHTPDSIFPNNGFSLHHDGTLVLYPMFAPNRRFERKPHLRQILEQTFDIKRVVDLTHYESKDQFLEGTGSMVLDRTFRIAYACRSPRTHQDALLDFCKQLDYRPILFDAHDRCGRPIYHTNVMMCVASNYIVLNLDAIISASDRELVLASAAATNKEIISIDMTQMEHFAGNMLQLHNVAGNPFLVLSTTALHCLTPAQKEKIERYNPLIVPDIPTIELHGGGSARCMMAECFFSKKHKVRVNISKK